MTRQPIMLNEWASDLPLYTLHNPCGHFVSFSGERKKRNRRDSREEEFRERNKEYTVNISIAQTSLGPWKFIRDMGSSSHRGLIMAPVKKQVVIT